MSARRIVFLLLALLLWLGALTGLPYEAAVEMRWAEDTIGHSALALALEGAEEPVRAAVWAQKRVDGRTVAVYSGDPLLLTGGRMSSGSAAACAVSEPVAREIWGSADVTGLTLTMGGRDYVVGGVYPSGAADVILHWDGAQESAFNRMAVYFPGQADGAQYRKALDFAASMGMSEPDEALDAPLLFGIARMLALVPGWAFIGLAAAWQWRFLRGFTVMRVPLRVPILVLFAAGMVWALGFPLAPPKWLLPTRWSDFAHWEALCREVAGRLHDFLRAAHSPLNSRDLYACLRVSAQAILSTALLLSAGEARTHKPGARPNESFSGLNAT